MSQRTNVCTRCNECKPLSEFIVRRDQQRRAHRQLCEACAVELVELRRKRDGINQAGRACLACDAAIPAEANWKRRFCSSACLHWYREHPPEVKRLPVGDRVCLACDTIIPAESDRKRKYCSDRCKSWAVGGGNAGRKRPPKAGRQCNYIGCKKSLDHRRIDVKYCGSLCYSRATMGRSALPDKVMCQECDSVFTPGDFVRWKYCSKECSQRQGQRVWRENNRLYMRLWGRNRRRLVRDNPFTVAVLERDWRRLVNRYGGCCAYCGDRPNKLHIDHVVPVSRGGRGGIGNILPACATCNVSKHALLLVEWRAGSRSRGSRRNIENFIKMNDVPPVSSERLPCALCGKSALIQVKGCCRSCYIYKRNNPNYPGDPAYRHCPACGTEIAPGRRRGATYCNKRCRYWATFHPGEPLPSTG